MGNGRPVSVLCVPMVERRQANVQRRTCGCRNKELRRAPMIDSLLMIGVIMAVIVGSGAFFGQVTAPGKSHISWAIVARSTIVGLILAGAIFALAILTWILHHRLAGVRHTMFVI